MNLFHGDCIEVMAEMEPESVDAICTDPPYGLEFMGKEWDRLDGAGFHAPKDEGRTFSNASGHMYDNLKALPRYGSSRRMQAWHEAWAREAFRVAKPSAYLLAFGGTRTVHRLASAIEDAGWIIRDTLVWAYASGFPKSKASLKPAWEPIVMARKPGPLRMLAIDECRIGVEGGTLSDTRGEATGVTYAAGSFAGDFGQPVPGLGRWPANIVLTDPIFDGGITGVVGGGIASYNPPGVFGQQRGDQPDDTAAAFAVRRDGDGIFGYGDTGTYSRFFLVPKAARSDREPVLGGLSLQAFGQSGGARAAIARGEDYQTGADISTGLNSVKQRANIHPTVKPVDLMRHLVRLVTPTGGTVLDPFLGSGTTAIAAEMEGFAWIGIEREAEYVAIAEARLNGTQRGLGLGA